MDVFKVSYFEAYDKLPVPHERKVGNGYKPYRPIHYIHGNSREEVIEKIAPFFKKDGYGDKLEKVQPDIVVEGVESFQLKVWESNSAYVTVEKIEITEI